MSQTQHQAAAHPTAAPAAAATAPKQLDPESVRQVVAKQDSVAGSVSALLTAVCGVIERALKDADPGGLQAFAKQIEADPKAWADAVMANTPSAVLTAGFAAVPTDLRDVFAQHAAQAQQAGGVPTPGPGGTQPAPHH